MGDAMMRDVLLEEDTAATKGRDIILTSTASENSTSMGSEPSASESEGSSAYLTSSLQRIVELQKAQVLKLWCSWASRKKAEEHQTPQENTKRNSQQRRKRGRADKDAPELGAEDVTLKKRLKGLHVIGCCLLTPEELKRHINELRKMNPSTFASLVIILRRLMEHKANKGIFNVPVDPVALEIPEYPRIIRNPMDLGTIRKRLMTEYYENAEDFAAELRLVFSNAMHFNKPQTPVHLAAKKCKKSFEEDFKKLLNEIQEDEEEDAAHDCEECEGNICELCGFKCRLFQEPVLRCSAPCKARIPRNAVYYRLGGDRGQHWCGRCHSNLPDEFIGVLGQVVRKSELEKRVHDENFSEAWIGCRLCSKKVHQICTLYHPSILHNEEDGIICALCVAKRCQLKLDPLPAKANASLRYHRRNARVHHARQTSKIDRKEPDAAALFQRADPWADTLPQTSMGEYLEGEMRKAASAVVGKSEASKLHLRVVSSRSFVTEYEARLHRWIEAQQKSCGAVYQGEKLTTQFPCKSKTVLIFQRIDGVDVLCFVLYVQEYGSSCPPPNRNKVYISYLDSVAYIEPAKVRTIVYQEVMVSYLQWVAARGFEQCFIWACPPQRGDAYILYCHPRWQRSPGVERLRKWYGSIIGTAMERGTVAAQSNYFDAFLSEYKPLLNTRSARTRKLGKDKSAHAGAFASPMTEYSPSFFNSSMEGFSMPKIVKPIEHLPYFYGDYLPNEIESMLNMLINPKITQGGRLQSSCDEQIAAWWREVWGAKTHAVLLNNDSVTPSSSSSSSSFSARKPKTPVLKPSEPLNLQQLHTPMWKLAPSANLNEVDLTAGFATPQQRNDWLLRKLATAIKPMAENFIVLDLKRSASPLEVVKLGDYLLAGDTSDPDPSLPAGIFDTRLEFLDMCKHNCLQFDELRRAKHSSLVLMHYHKKALLQGMQNVTPVKKRLNEEKLVFQ